jgi:predicted dehydrogenase
MAAPDRVMRALVVGSGWARHAAAVFAAHPGVRLVGVVGRGSSRTLELAARYGVPAYTSMETAIEEARPALAAVAAGEIVHPELVRRLLIAGCNVLCSHPVAREAKEVRELAALAAQRKRLLETDYSMRETPGFRVAQQILEAFGPPLRISARSPGRALVIALDLACALAGPVEAVCGSVRYPPAFEDRRRRAAEAFAPTALLEHSSGCVTTVTPVPHAESHAAHRLEISTAATRLDLELPAGEVIKLVRRKGSVERSLLLAEAPARDADEAFGTPMRALVTGFVQRVLAGKTGGILNSEAHVREVWLALGRATREKKLIPIWAASHQEEG